MRVSEPIPYYCCCLAVAVLMSSLIENDGNSYFQLCIQSFDALREGFSIRLINERLLIFRKYVDIRNISRNFSTVFYFYFQLYTKDIFMI